jgi:uncharacterized protein YhbP (UPF0306 family)
MTLATAAVPDDPHAAPVYFAANLDDPQLENLRRGDLRLFYFSDPASQHAQDVLKNPRVAAAIYPEVSGWQEIRGLQLRGLAYRLPAGAEWQAGWACYQAKFPFASEMQAIIARNDFCAFLPDWIRLVDNRLGFGYKQEWELA